MTSVDPRDELLAMQLDGHPVLSPPSLWRDLGRRHATP
jgi:hypothetical protein